MRLTMVGDLFVALTTYDEREIPKFAGFKWNPAATRWESRSARQALSLRAYADPPTIRAIEERMNGARQQAQSSRAPISMLDVPSPEGLEFKPYQRAGISYMAALDYSLNADEMGLGKTVQALGVINALPAPHRVLVIAPASLRLNWKYEAKRWLTHKMNVVIVTDTWFSGIRHDDPLAPPMMVIISRRAAVIHRAAIEATKWDYLIVDECQNLCNSKTEQSRAVLGGQKVQAGHRETWPPIRATKTMFLTGTPIVNRPQDLWPIVHRCDRKGLGGDWLWFKRRYVDREDHLAELHEYLRGTFMVRRQKKDVLAELPAKRRQILLVEVDGADVLREERLLISRKAQELAQLRHENAVQRLNQWRGAAIQEITAIRHKTALKKMPSVVEHVFNTLDEAEKVVVFAHHHDMIDGLAEQLGDCAVTFDGRVTPIERDARVKRFQNDPACRVFIGSIRAAGLGLTLTAASVVVFAELDWTPAAMVQAEDRLHRIGQQNAVLVQHLVIDGSIDQRMAEILIKKSIMIDMILDGTMPEGAKVSILDEVLNG